VVKEKRKKNIAEVVRGKKKKITRMEETKTPRREEILTQTLGWKICK